MDSVAIFFSLVKQKSIFELSYHKKWVCMLCMCICIGRMYVFKGYGGLFFFTLIDNCANLVFWVLFIYFWMCWVLVDAPSFLQLQWVSIPSTCSMQASYCGDLSCCRARALECMGSVAVAQGLSCPMACEIFLDQGSSPHSALALVGTLLTTGPIGKLQGGVFFF